MEWLREINWKSIFLFNEKVPLIFTQSYFWIFFAIVLAIFSVIHRHRAGRNAFLFIVSLFFYWKTSGFYFFLLLFSTFSDYLIGFGIHGAKSKGTKRFWLILSVVINLAVLFYFKYTYLFVDTYNSVAGTEYHPGNIFTWLVNALFGTDFITDKIILPVGISFFTFQTISYAVDVYQDKIKPVKSILDFGFYVSFFPQLVAGPIVRAADFIPQIYQPYRLTRAEFGLAVFWILQGLIKKVFLADYVGANFVDRVFENPMLFTGFENLMSLYGYSLQVYADFSGYTDIAIGVSLLMGFRLNTNFNSPYKAESTANFWRRWHISLSTWLRDYLYIPMGGSRGASVMTIIFLPLIAGLFIFYVGPNAIVPVILALIVGVFVFMWVTYYYPNVKQEFTTNINLALTMLLGGLWHGSSWLFVIWGGLNGAGIVVHKMGAAIANWTKKVPWGYRLGVLFFGGFLTFALVSLFKMGGMVWEGLGVFGGWVGLSLFGLIVYLLLRRWVEGKGWWIILARIWGIFLTFNFISYTRIWFRQQTMDGTGNMLHQIYHNFSIELAPQIIMAYAPVFLVIYYGMVVHWLPTWMKDGYRGLFIRLPLGVQLLVVVAVVFLLFQVMSSETQAFIYFQF